MISAQVGRITGKGLAGNMRRHYPGALIYPLIALLLVANIINIGADLGAMAAALRLLVDGPQLIFVAAFAVVTILLEVFMRYSRYASVLRWLTISSARAVESVDANSQPDCSSAILARAEPTSRFRPLPRRKSAACR
jgi:Mn2+/Fe2+ NRAMP family transporter